MNRSAKILQIIQTRVHSAARLKSCRMLSSTPTDAVSDVEENETEKRKEIGLNRVQLLGRVGRKPELRGSSDHPCYTFPLATNQIYRKASGEEVSRTDWHRISVFLPSLRDYVIPRIQKGDRIYTEGTLNYNKYTDDAGKSTFVTSIVAGKVIILSQSQRRNLDDELD